MVKTLLKTKLHIPDPRPDWIERDHLIQRMNAGLACQLSLLSAAAGYGKTTLLVSWLNQLRIAKIWLSLNDGDNDPVHFISYFIASLQNIRPDLGASIISSLQNPQPMEFEPILDELINQIYAIEDDFVMVLDDFHCITSPTLQKAIHYLVDHQPQNMHLVISTRTDPPIDLVRLRGQSKVLEIRQDDFRTSNQEASNFIKGILGELLTDEEIIALNRRTEGWFAGLKLAAMSLKHTKGKKAFIKEISGTNTFIADYLTGEVLKQLPAELNTFLLYSSVLDRLSGPICEAVTGQTQGQKTLEFLQESNFFITPLDDQQIWYRYHTLFSDLLRNRLQRLHPTQVAELHRRASQWLITEGFVLEAIEHALQGGEFTTAANLISQWAESGLLEGQIVTFTKYTTQLPEEIQMAYPRIRVFYIFLLIVKGTPSDKILQMVEDLEKADVEGEVSGEVTLIRAYLGLDQEKNYQMLTKAIKILPLDRTYFRGFANSYFGLIQIMRGKIDHATHSFLEVVQTSKRAENTFLTVLGLCRLGDIAMIRGQLYEAEAAYRQALDFVKNQHDDIHPLVGEALIGLGRVYYGRNNPQDAKSYLTQGIALARQIGETRTIYARTILACIYLLDGNIDLAHQTMLEAELITANSTNQEIHTPVYVSSRIRFELLHGNIRNALHWISKSDLPQQIDRDYLQTMLDQQPLVLIRANQLVSYSMVKIATEKYADALAILNPLLDQAKHMGWSRDILLIQIQRAIAYRGLDDWETALRCIESALVLAEPEQYIRPFLDIGKPLFELLHHAAGNNLSVHFAQRILSEMQQMKILTEKEDGQVEYQPLIEPLTKREIEVLRSLTSGHTNKRIARELIISPGTVKKHLDHIYQKLGVHTRAEAVSRAHDLNLI